MKKRDVILVVLLIAIAGFIYLIINTRQNTDDVMMVVINVDGSLYKECSLNKNQKVDIQNKYGHNTIVIKDKKVYMLNADCPDKYCVKQGSIVANGSSIVCLPNKLTVEIKSNSKSDGINIDAIAE